MKSVHAACRLCTFDWDRLCGAIRVSREVYLQSAAHHELACVSRSISCRAAAGGAWRCCFTSEATATSSTRELAGYAEQHLRACNSSPYCCTYCPFLLHFEYPNHLEGGYAHCAWHATAGDLCSAASRLLCLPCWQLIIFRAALYVSMC